MVHGDPWVTGKPRDGETPVLRLEARFRLLASVLRLLASVFRLRPQPSLRLLVHYMGSPGLPAGVL